MSLLFPRWTNTLARVMLVAIAATVTGVLGLLFLYVRSPYFTQQGNPVEQPVEFDHRHHVGDDAIDCRYCHTSVETAASAGYPSTSTCMNCHGQIWNRSPLLNPVRRAYFTDRPIPWNRVHRLPDFVYFNHSIHVRQGIGCVSCHGRMDQSARVAQDQPLTMSWCLECHREPERFLRPREFITSMTWTPPPSTDQLTLGQELKKSYDVRTRTSCTACHR
jgi:hypothetical protein